MIHPADAGRTGRIMRMSLASARLRADAINDEIEMFRLKGATYEPAGWFAGSAVAKCHVLPGFTLSLDELFATRR